MVKSLSIMKTNLALLRGINVGGNNKIEMAKLKKTFERLGLANVRTFIASGNVIFGTNETDQTKLTAKIETAIRTDYGINIKVLIRDLESIKRLTKAIPASWVNDKNMKCDVMFLWKEIDDKKVLDKLPYNPVLEDIKYARGAVIWRINRDKVSKSRMFTIVGTKLHQQMTIRNPNTVRKLYALMIETDKELRTNDI